MKRILTTLLFFGLFASIGYGQTEIDTDPQTIDQTDRSGAITYNINRRSNVIEFPFGYSQPILKCTPLRLSLIILQEGEKILSIAAGDTRRWKFTQTYQGTAGDVTPIIQVKPITSGITTNLIVTTNKRTYDITLDAPEIEGNSTNPMQFFTRRISFYYPKEENFGGIAVAEPPMPTQATPDSMKKVDTDKKFVDLSKMHFRYETEKGKYGFPWEPLAIYDNGTHVFIKIPNTIAAQQLPSLYRIGGAENRQFINFSFNPETRILKTRIFKKAVLTYTFKHPGFLGLGTVSDMKELFITRK